MIEVKAVTKTFGRGKKTLTAVDGVSFDVRPGEIFGLIGTNGAGKTTLMRMIATMLRPTAGSVRVMGKDAAKQGAEVRRDIGILFGGDAGLYDRLTARENIEYFARLSGMDKETARARTEEIARFFNMESYLDRYAGKFSKGMKQKTCFARAIVHNPPVMLLDEPTSGLDVLAAEEVAEFMRLCRAQGKTILLSTHDMGEVEELCDRMAIISGGRILDEGTEEQLLERHRKERIKDVFFALTGGNGSGV